MVRIEEPRFPIFVCTKNMHPDLKIRLDRTAKLPLAEQIRASISRTIEAGLLAPGTRLPSWQDLAALRLRIHSMTALVMVNPMGE